LSTGSQN